MAKTISLGLSLSEIKAAQKELAEYKKTLNKKTRLFVEKLADLGMEVAKATMSSVPADDEPGIWDVQTNMTSSGDVSSARITLSGNKVLFIEFGAGIRYASPQNPLAAELGYGAGTYPGQTHVPNPGYWFYKGEDGQKRRSYGNRAYMPMYHASEALALEMRRIAREVFDA